MLLTTKVNWISVVKLRCACAGPYGQYLLGISDELAEAYIQFLYKQEKNSSRHDWNSNNYEIFKPGFTRFNLVFFLENERADFILNAIKFVAEHGWKFLPFYEFDIKSGSFKHSKSQVNNFFGFSLVSIGFFLLLNWVFTFSYQALQGQKEFKWFRFFEGRSQLPKN